MLERLLGIISLSM